MKTALVNLAAQFMERSEFSKRSAVQFKDNPRPPSEVWNLAAEAWSRAATETLRLAAQVGPEGQATEVAGVVLESQAAADRSEVRFGAFLVGVAVGVAGGLLL